MKFYLGKNVFDAALDRIRYLYDEFGDIMVCISGGKDSTVLMNLSLIVAEEKSRLPLEVMFLDQEVEWQCAIDYIRGCMNDPRIKPIWLQIPMRMGNASSLGSKYLMAWQGDPSKWMRPKEPNSIHENVYGADRFKKFFGSFLDVHLKGRRGCMLVGIRTQESPGRLLTLASQTYKDITWGKQLNKKKEQFNFYPIYDWHVEDVWKAIHDNDWPYCPLYDYMYMYGIPQHQMRLSNLIHETAVRTLFFMQEIEPETWAKLSHRVEGVNTTNTLNYEDFYAVSELPYMFKTWKEYRDYLLENLFDDEEKKKVFRRRFRTMDAVQADGKYVSSKGLLITDRQVAKVQIDSILCNDYEGTKMHDFNAACKYREPKKGIR